jgi:hypothetical protein
MMEFGATLQPASSIEPSTWIDASPAGTEGTVGALVPPEFDAVLRIEAPEPVPDDWWTMYRELFVTVAAVGARHTSVPDSAWFGVWEGHGFDNVAAPIESLESNGANQSRLDRIPRFCRPDRNYYLLTGPLAAVSAMKYPGFDGWRNPDLVWPDDRSWFVATDVDFWSLYVGGSRQFLADLERNVPTPCRYVNWTDSLAPED